MIEVDIKLRRKNFDVEIQETFGPGITGIYGPSGSGKTSLLHTISGLLEPQKGRLMINGRTVFDVNDKINIPVNKRHIGYVFQEGRLFPHMSVEKNLQYGVKKNCPKRLSFSEVVSMLNLNHILHSMPANISGGERQRTALGRSLLSSPDILLLDEPFSAVDTQLRNQILPFLLRIQRKVNIPILVVSHDLPDLLKLTNKLCVIQDGKCIGHDDYHQLIKSGNLVNVIGSGSIVNSISMKVECIDFNNGITILSAGKRESNIRVICEKSKEPYHEGQELKIFINSEDIALSSEKLKGVTIQNQLEGVITDIIERESSTLCMVDVGFKLVVEITVESGKRLEIIIGRKIWCLFKSVAIDVLNSGL